MKRINRMINEWLDRKFRERMHRAYPDADCDRDFKERMQRTYPDAEKFLKTIKVLPIESRLPVFRLDNHIASYGSISVCCKADDYSREVITHELSDALKEWTHAGNISRVSIDRFYKDGDFVLKIIFRKNTSGDKRADNIFHID